MINYQVIMPGMPTGSPKRSKQSDDEKKVFKYKIQDDGQVKLKTRNLDVAHIAFPALDVNVAFDFTVVPSLIGVTADEFNEYFKYFNLKEDDYAAYHNNDYPFWKNDYKHDPLSVTTVSPVSYVDAQMKSKKNRIYDQDKMSVNTSYKMTNKAWFDDRDWNMIAQCCKIACFVGANSFCNDACYLILSSGDSTRFNNLVKARYSFNDFPRIDDIPQWDKLTMTEHPADSVAQIVSWKYPSMMNLPLIQSLCKTRLLGRGFPITNPNDVIGFLDEYRQNAVAHAFIPEVKTYFTYGTLTTMSNGITRYKKWRQLVVTRDDLRRKYDAEYDARCRERNTQRTQRRLLAYQFKQALDDIIGDDAWSSTIDDLFNQIKTFSMVPVPEKSTEGIPELDAQIAALTDPNTVVE
jgi:hypothetical protein